MIEGDARWFAKRLQLLGKNIRYERERHGLSQRELAETLGVDVMTVSRWERGLIEPSYLTLQLLANALKLRFDTPF